MGASVASARLARLSMIRFTLSEVDTSAEADTPGESTAYWNQRPCRLEVNKRVIMGSRLKVTCIAWMILLIAKGQCTSGGESRRARSSKLQGQALLY